MISSTFTSDFINTSMPFGTFKIMNKEIRFYIAIYFKTYIKR